MLLMSTVPSVPPISIEDYLRGEETARRKYEYVEGVVYAMAGASNLHNLVATNSTGSIHVQLRGKSCRVFNSDNKIRVRLSRGTRFYCPDLSVACRLNPPTDSFQDAPVVIVEVVSESTRRTDENEKRDAYLSIDSLWVYVLVEQATATAIVYRRADSGFDRESYVGIDKVIPLPEIECSLALSELYENVEFPSPPTDGDEYDDEA